MDFIKRHKSTIAVTAIALALLAGLGTYSYKRVEAYELKVENQYRRAFYDLTDSVKNIDVALSKGIITTEPKHLAQIANEITQYSSYAKACLGQLPIGDAALDNTQKFLTQVGDYTRMLAAKSIDNVTITEQQHQTMMELSKYANELFQSLNDLEEQILSSKKGVSDVVAVAREVQQAGGNEAGRNAFSDIEANFLNYPSLIYDGPFSDHMENIEPEMLKGKPEISMEEAQQKALAFIGNDNVKALEHASDGEGRIHTYGFTAVTGEENRSIYISVTKQGGYVISMLDTKNVEANELDYEEGIRVAQEFLNEKGFYGFKDSYYETVDGIMTINFAATQDGVILYPDLIKLKIAGDTKQIIGFESRGYLTHHKQREQLTPKISAETARKDINKNLSADKINLCYIPLENGTEVLCYEIKGKFENKNYLIYVNANTGIEEKILLVLDQENSLLTM